VSEAALQGGVLSTRVIPGLCAGIGVVLFAVLLIQDISTTDARLLLVGSVIGAVVARRNVYFAARRPNTPGLNYSADNPVIIALALTTPTAAAAFIAFVVEVQTDVANLRKRRLLILNSGAGHALLVLAIGTLGKAVRPDGASVLADLLILCGAHFVMMLGTYVVTWASLRSLGLPVRAAPTFLALAIPAEAFLAFGPLRAAVGGDVASFAVFATLPLLLMEVVRRMYRLREEVDAFEGERAEMVHLLIDADDRQRKLLAGDLHDGPLQATLAGVIRLQNATELLDQGDVTAARAQLEHLEAVLEDASTELRALLQGLTPGPALDAGIEHALRQICLQHDENFPQGITLEVALPRQLDKDSALLTYRVVHEAVINASRHSDASHLVVTATSDGDGRVHVTITDDGVGIPANRLSAATDEGHLGLATLYERVRMARGTVAITPGPDGRGTRIDATFRVSSRAPSPA
jgi:signal transduction histidine kinase